MDSQGGSGYRVSIEVGGCRQCGKWIVFGYGRDISYFCSDVCNDRYMRDNAGSVTETCAHCGVSFEREIIDESLKIELEKDYWFCNSSCYGKFIVDMRGVWHR